LTIIAAFVLTVFFYSLVSARLERTVFTAPIIFALVGASLHALPPELANLELNRDGLLRVAELGLVMTLFTDAAHIRLQDLTRSRGLPARLLTVGMLLTIVLGAVGAKLVFESLSWWEAGILSAILAPTDAGLGAVIVNSPKLPVRIRQALNVEAGLNDGLSVPFLMCFIALALESREGAGAVLTRFVGEQIGYGGLVGGGIGLAGGWLLGLACRRRWIAGPMRQLGLVALPLLAVMASEVSGASMFIAAYVAGFAVQPGFPDAGRESVEFTDTWGQLLDFFVFLLFGLFVARAWPQFTAAHLVYGLLSLTLVRVLPVALALAGTGLSRWTVLFMGWFGPRGLASIVLGLVYLEKEASLPGEDVIRLSVMATVMLSTLLHGFSALPGIGTYARRLDALGRDAAEYGEENPKDP